jgi:hypothetical protein
MGLSHRQENHSMDPSATVPVALVPEAPAGLFGRLAALPAATRMKLGVGVAALAAA